MDQEPIVLYFRMKGIALDAIHDDLVRTLGKDAVAYSMVTKYTRSAQLSGRKEANPPEAPDVERSPIAWKFMGLLCHRHSQDGNQHMRARGDFQKRNRGSMSSLKTHGIEPETITAASQGGQSPSGHQMVECLTFGNGALKPSANRNTSLSFHLGALNPWTRKCPQNQIKQYEINIVIKNEFDISHRSRYKPISR
jgi:hypothetical protein